MKPLLVVLALTIGCTAQTAKIQQLQKQVADLQAENAQLVAERDAAIRWAIDLRTQLVAPAAPTPVNVEFELSPVWEPAPGWKMLPSCQWISTGKNMVQKVCN